MNAVIFSKRYIHFCRQVNRIACLTLFIFCTFYSIFLQARDIPGPGIDTQALRELSNKRTWHKLLHYEKNSSAENGYLSAIHSPEFFFSAEGRTDSYKELLATLEAFSKPVGDDPNTHAQCLFRGRYVWLKPQLHKLEHLNTVVDCPDYNNWSLNQTTQSISIIFATGYLGNPASYYGHTLLKLNSDKTDSSTKLEDISVNFGAIIPDGEGPIVYILKGLFGGYDAGFSHIQYYFHNHNYGENELRDMWEYELELNNDQLNLVMGHAWELLGKRYTYYFLDQNCVYRMAEVLEVIDGVDIIPDNEYWTIPQSLLQKMANAKVDGKPLVKKISYHPSRQSRLYTRFNSLNQSEKLALHKEIDNRASFDSTEFTSLPLDSRQSVLDTLIDYYQYLRDPEELEKDPNNMTYRKTLSKRFDLPPGGKSLDFISQNPPHKGRKASMFQTGITHNEVLGNGLRVRLRPAYYDALDADFGHVNNSMLTMADLEMSYLFNKRQARINRFDIIRIESINGNNTGLPGDRSVAWGLSLGWDEVALDCGNQCLAANLKGNIGYSLPAYNGAILGGFVGGAIQESKKDKGTVYVSTSVFADFVSDINIKTRFSVEHRNYILGTASPGTQHRLESQYQLDTNLGIRGYVTRTKLLEAGISLIKYF